MQVTREDHHRASYKSRLPSCKLQEITSCSKLQEKVYHRAVTSCSSYKRSLPSCKLYCAAVTGESYHCTAVCAVTWRHFLGSISQYMQVSCSILCAVMFAICEPILQHLCAVASPYCVVPQKGFAISCSNR